jgi:hypothetical protein
MVCTSSLVSLLLSLAGLSTLAYPAKEMPGLHNIIRVNAKLLSGSVPEGDTGFQTLQKLGVKTIISVDGAKPEVERAKRFSLRYVHLPIGYDGVPAVQGLRLTRAVRDLPGLIYMHCHHGKHRSPAAAAVVKLCLDDQCTVKQAINLMKQAGTDPGYVGLYASPIRLKRPTADELNKISSDFPEIASTGTLVHRMVEIDTRWEHLKLLERNDWKLTKEHPDLDPAHEAMLLREHYMELGRLPETKQRPLVYRQMLKQAEEEACQLHIALQQHGMVKRSLAEVAFKASVVSCTRCHAQYRDIPQR